MGALAPAKAGDDIWAATKLADGEEEQSRFDEEKFAR